MALDKSQILLPSSAVYGNEDLSRVSDHVRVFSLLPAQDRTATLRGALNTHRLSSPDCKFEALSYVWGSALRDQPISIGDDVFMVGQNLATALRYLRDQKEPRGLWVDAICINQDSMTEKSHQVRQMHRIYSQASRVLVWLGETSSDTIEAMEYWQKRREGNNRLERPLTALKDIFDRPWWNRIWVIQEVLAAKEDPFVLCGDYSVEWSAVEKDLFSLAWKGATEGPRESIFDDPISMLLLWGLDSLEMDRGAKRTGRNDLWNLLFASASHQASEPRDHVYALLGLAQEAQALPFDIDYTKPVGELFQAVMVMKLRSKTDVGNLLFASGLGASITPSWCTDFSKPKWTQCSWDYRWRPNRLNKSEEAGASIGKEASLIHHDPGRGTLQVKGVTVGRIHKRSAFSVDDMYQCDMLHETNPEGESERFGYIRESVDRLRSDVLGFTVEAFLALTKRLGDDRAAQTIAQGDVWRVVSGVSDFVELLGDSEDGETTPGNGYAVLEKFHNLLFDEENEQYHLAKTQWSIYLVPKELKDFGLSFYFKACFFIATKVANQYWFTTDAGYFGCCRDPLEAGDALCILFGCSLPVILRYQADGTYKIVTFANTHDIMYGEFIRDNPSLEEQFTLS